MSRRRKNPYPQSLAMVKERERQAKKAAEPEVCPEKLDAFLLVQRDLLLLKRSAAKEDDKSDFYSDMHNNILSRALEYLRELDPRPPVEFSDDIPF